MFFAASFHLADLECEYQINFDAFIFPFNEVGDRCSRLGGALAVIRNKKQQTAVESIVKRLYPDKHVCSG